MNIYDILAEIQEELGVNKSGLFRKKVDIEKVSELVEKIKDNLPQAIEEANYIVASKNKILESARTEAERALATANEKASELVSDSVITRQAQESANKMLELANKRSVQLLDTTKNNVDKILKAVEDYLAEHLNIVHDSRDELSATLVQLKNNLKPKE